MSDYQADEPSTVARLLRDRVKSTPIDLPVSGSSMAGVISSASTVHVEDAAAPRRGEIWAFIDDEARIVVHRVRRIDQHTVTGRGSGNAYDDHPVDKNRLVGRVRRATDPAGGIQHFGSTDRLRAAAGFLLRSAARRMGLDRYSPKVGESTQPDSHPRFP